MGLITPNPEAELAAAELAESSQAAPTEPQEEGEPASPEEQEAYDKVVSAGSEVLHGEQTNPEIMSILESGRDNPGEALADVAMMIIGQIDEQSGGKIPEGIIIPAADDILSQAGELAEVAGLFKWDESTKGSAAQSLWKKAGEKYDFDPQEIQELIDSMGKDEIEGIRSKQDQIAQGSPQQAAPAAPPMGAV